MCDNAVLSQVDLCSAVYGICVLQFCSGMARRGQDVCLFFFFKLNRIAHACIPALGK